MTDLTTLTEGDRFTAVNLGNKTPMLYQADGPPVRRGIYLFIPARRVFTSKRPTGSPTYGRPLTVVVEAPGGPPPA